MVKLTHPLRPSRGSGSEEGFIRDDLNGTTYIGEGCWGAPLRKNNDDKSWTKASGSFNQFKLVFVSMDGIEIRTIKTDNADEVADGDPDNRFKLPAGLDLWNPNGESVLYLEKKNAVRTHSEGNIRQILHKEQRFILDQEQAAYRQATSNLIQQMRQEGKSKEEIELALLERS